MQIFQGNLDFFLSTAAGVFSVIVLVYWKWKAVACWNKFVFSMLSRVVKAFKYYVNNFSPMLYQTAKHRSIFRLFFLWFFFVTVHLFGCLHRMSLLKLYSLECNLDLLLCYNTLDLSMKFVHCYSVELQCTALYSEGFHIVGIFAAVFYRKRFHQFFESNFHN